MIKENFIELFENSFKENWDLYVFTDYGEDVTMKYSEVAIEIAKLHLLFEKTNIKKGDKIALIGRNTSQWACTYLAVVTYGAIIVPILQDFNSNDVHHIVNHSESTFLFLSDYIWDNLEEEKMPNLRAVFSLTDFRCIVQKDGEHIQKIVKALPSYFTETYPNGYTAKDISYVKKDNKELVLINYTSGTTGFSKGVMLSGNSLAGNITFALSTCLIKPKYRILSFLPLAHTYGCAFDFLTPVCGGSHITFLGKIPSPKVLIKAFEEVKPSVIFTVPLILEKIYKNQIQPKLNNRTLKLVLNIPILDNQILTQFRKKLTTAFGGEFSQLIIGGAALNKEVEDFLLRIKFPFTIGYGMTECGPLISYSHFEEFIPSSAGKILDSMELRIDSDDPYNKAGEICVRGEHLMDGYYKNKEATKGVIDKDGWLHTGDLGTTDEKGNIFIRGRSKSMILSSSGQNIYPEEIEAKLNNMPFVMESLVIEKEGKLIALVYPDYEAVDEANISQEDIDIVMEENLKNLNKMTASYENVAKIKLYPNEFEKTPKKSIKRYLYSDFGD
jgi:long-chain acyl-CoA synthetase